MLSAAAEAPKARKERFHAGMTRCGAAWLTACCGRFAAFVRGTEWAAFAVLTVRGHGAAAPYGGWRRLQSRFCLQRHAGNQG